ncbi:hypothetical protein AB0D97_28155 [Streptomyces roseus]|uniref:hypothetical protein n=1 Tax=Streptomyces roseus TaxID=66430 RepID=UPI0033F86B45
MPWTEESVRAAVRDADDTAGGLSALWKVEAQPGFLKKAHPLGEVLALAGDPGVADAVAGRASAAPTARI